MVNKERGRCVNTFMIHENLEGNGVRFSFVALKTWILELTPHVVFCVRQAWRLRNKVYENFPKD